MHHRPARSGAHRLRRRAPRARAVGALGTLFLAFLVTGPSPTSASTAFDPSSAQMRGRAHGGSVDLKLADGLGRVGVGDIAPQTLPCNPTMGFDHVKEDDNGVSSQLNFLGSVVVPDPDDGIVLRANAVRNSGGATADRSHAEVHERSRLADLFLLGGLVTAQAVQADAHSHLEGGTVSTRTNEYEADPDKGSGTTMWDLRVDARPVASIGTEYRPKPNTEVALPEPLRKALRIVLNEQRPLYRWVTLPDGSKVNMLEGIEVTAIKVYVLDYAGHRGEIAVAQASTRLAPAPARISGYAYGSRGNVGSFLASGKTALLGMPCGGTKGKELVRSVAGADVRNGDGDGEVLLRQGTLTSTVQGVVGTTENYSKTSHNAEQVALLPGETGEPVLRASVLRTSAKTVFDSSGRSRVGTMDVVDLVVNGEPVAEGQVPPNTGKRVPGVGHVILNHQMCSNTRDDPATTDVNEGAGTADRCDEEPLGREYLSLTVVGVHLFVTEANDLGLPIGSEVLLSVSHADIFKPVAAA